MPDNNSGSVGGIRLGQRELPDVIGRKFSAVNYSLVGGVVDGDAGARVGSSVSVIRGANPKRLSERSVSLKT